MTPEVAFDQYSRPVYRFVYRLTQRQDVAEDIVQEVFLALIRAPERFDAARGAMQTYLFAVARNLVLKRYRDYRREEQSETEDVPAPLLDHRNVFDLRAAVASAIADLPPLQQEAVILFEYEGVTLEELAQIVAADVGTVKSRLHRARARLRRTLASYRPEGKAYGTV